MPAEIQQKNKKKVLFIINASSGLYKFRRETVESAAKDNIVFIIANSSEFASEFEKTGCVFIKSDVKNHGTNLLQEFSLYRFYKREIKKLNPDIVFTYTIKPNIYAGLACSSLGVPYVPTITGLGSAVEYTGLMQKITIPLYRLAMRKAKKVFFQNSDNMEFMLKNNIVRTSYELLPGSGVNLDQFTLLEYPKKDTVDFFFFGRIIKEKGIGLYLEAAEHIGKKYNNTRFHICGNAKNTDFMQKINMLSEAGIVIYHGRQSDVRPMHLISSCTIHPTYYPEGMSNVILESAASGRPIITTDRPGCREAIDVGTTGYLAKPNNTQDLIAKIEQFLALTWEQRREMGLAGRKKMEQHFDRKKVTENYLAEI